MDLGLGEIAVEEIRHPEHHYETSRIVGRLHGEPVVVKTFAFNPPIVRRLLGWLCRREARLLQALEPVARLDDGHLWLPADARQCGPWGVLMPRLPGRPLRDLQPGELPPAFMARLEEAVARLHRARVVHLDLKNARNILVTDSGHPVLLDFAGALSFRRWPLLGGWLVRLLSAVDRAALLKWKQRYQPGALTPEEQRHLLRMRRLRRLWPFPVRWLYNRRRA